jgi:hypothetical protein
MSLYLMASASFACMPPDASTKKELRLEPAVVACQQDFKKEFQCYVPLSYRNDLHSPSASSFTNTLVCAWLLKI